MGAGGKGGVLTPRPLGPVLATHTPQKRIFAPPPPLQKDDPASPPSLRHLLEDPSHQIMIPNLITFLIYSGLRGASSWSLRNCSIVPEREGGFPFLFQGREKDPIVPGTVCAPYFACTELLHQTWALGQQGAGQRVGRQPGEEARGRGESPHLVFLKPGIGCEFIS